MDAMQCRFATSYIGPPPDPIPAVRTPVAPDESAGLPSIFFSDDAMRVSQAQEKGKGRVREEPDSARLVACGVYGGGAWPRDGRDLIDPEESRGVGDGWMG